MARAGWVGEDEERKVENEADNVGKHAVLPLGCWTSVAVVLSGSCMETI